MSSKILYFLSIYLLLQIAVDANSQFPAPQSLVGSLTYIEIDQWGYCDGATIFGPDYCTRLVWSPPDTSTTAARLASYNIYLLWEGATDTALIASVSDTTFEDSFGFIGSVWITASYSDPDGESAPSNIVKNDALPIGIKERNSSEIIQYNSVNRCVSIKTEQTPFTARIIDINGITVYTTNNNEKIDLSGLPDGLYIIDVSFNATTRYSKKIIL